MNKSKKYLAATFLVLSLLVSGTVGSAVPAHAQMYTTTSTTTSAEAPCLNFTFNMGISSSNRSVLALQTFLNARGFMSYYPPTGYFGPITYAAVARFQAAYGIPNTGFVGPLTRAQISSLSCGTIQPSGSVKIYNLAPTAAPVGATVSITGFGFTANNIIRFAGDGIGPIAASGGIAISCTTDPSCIPGIRQTIAFTIPSYVGPYCPSGIQCPMYPSRLLTPGTYPVYVTNENGTSNTMQLTVTDSSVNTGGVTISSMSPSVGPTGTTVTVTGTGFNADNSVSFDGSVIAHVPSTQIYTIVCNGYPNCTAPQTTLTFTVPSTIAPYCAPGMMCAMYLRLVTPGVYGVSIGNSNGTSGILNFTVTGTTTNGAPLSITGIDAPTQLSMSTPGTWTVHTNASSAGTLHYSVVWGDEGLYTTGTIPLPATAASPYSSASFSHTYQRAGTYNPSFTVSDDYGHTATTSASIVVMPLN